MVNLFQGKTKHQHIIWRQIILRQMNKDEGIDIAILHLAKPENHDINFDVYSLLTQLSVPGDIQKLVLQLMYQRGYIDGPPAIGKPIVHVTKKGLQYADGLKEKHFEEHNKPLNPVNTPALPLDETCEILFQMHVNESFSHWWTKESFNNQPSNLSVAKELLLSKGVLYSKTSTKGHTSTYLNPDFYNTATCKEALAIALEQNKPNPSVHITTHGDNSPAAWKELSFNQTNNPETPKRKWYQKWIDEFIKNTAQFTFVFIVSLITGVGIGKSCNQSTNQVKQQPTDLNILQNPSSDTIKNFKK